MSNFTIDFTNKFLPEVSAPFYSWLEKLFRADSEKTRDLAIHCPNVIRGIKDIMTNHGKDFIKDEHNNDGHNDDINYVAIRIESAMAKINECLEIPIKEKLKMEAEKSKMTNILQIAALYHDVGKYIRQANHPRLGCNILRNLDIEQREKMVEGLVLKDGDNEKESKSKEHRFSLLCSIVEHHDKFGVVSTGEASLAIFSDILYFRSAENTISGIKKNITSVMLLNLADIAAVCTADDDVKTKAGELVSSILDDRSLIQGPKYDELLDIWENKKSYLGLSYDKVDNILDDWEELINAIDDITILGDRTKLREHLIRLDQNPHRTIKRLIRLIKECCYTTDCNALLSFITETDMESTLVSFFGAHQFADFCMKIAYIVKMDYGLKFFKGILCYYVRAKILNTKEPDEKDAWVKLASNEKEKLDSLARSSGKEMQINIRNMSIIFIQVISGIIMRYSSLFDVKIESAYRFGLQMRTLTDDKNVREEIFKYLCSEPKMENIALTWIADEVTFWSMD